jgi:hypothetical protein
MPEFPVYDTLEIEGQTLEPYRADYSCNWLQVLDAILDPIHTTFLHSRMSRAQFSEGMAEIGELLFYQREMSFLGANVRRVGDNVWVRVNELVLPNYTQAGAAFSADGTRPIYYGRTAFSRWVVPIDDENTTAFAWAIFGDRADPKEYNTPEGYEMIEQGERLDRSYEERQRFPGDAEAVEGMGKWNTWCRATRLSFNTARNCASYAETSKRESSRNMSPASGKIRSRPTAVIRCCAFLPMARMTLRY